MSRKDELRSELEVLLRTARELPPDTDAYLAETFIRQLERTKRPRSWLLVPKTRVRSRLGAMLLALVALAVGGPLALREYASPSGGSCVPVVVLTYRSMPAAKLDFPRMRRNGYILTGSYQLQNGRVIFDYGREGGCPR